ncbi:hypothetical protein CIW49_26255 [Mycolicibacterium sp. P1-18]|nr:hypothetical protein CIW49_26255 [Mycolicibacterium sp. P1-18]
MAVVDAVHSEDSTTDGVTGATDFGDRMLPGGNPSSVGVVEGEVQAVVGGAAVRRGLGGDADDAVGCGVGGRDPAVGAQHDDPVVEGGHHRREVLLDAP